MILFKAAYLLVGLCISCVRNSLLDLFSIRRMYLHHFFKEMELSL